MMTVCSTIGLALCLMSFVMMWPIMVAEVGVVLIGRIIKGKEP